MATLEQEIRRNIRTIQDYPRKGVTFKDLTTLWKNGPLARKVTRAFVSKWKDRKVDKIVGIEARGFIAGAPVADRFGIGFVPARKVGNLPGKKLSVNYELEYGRQGLEIHLERNLERRQSPRRRRPSSDRGHREGSGGTGREARGEGRGIRLRRRAQLPQREGEADRVRNLLPGEVRLRIEASVPE